MRRLLYVSKRDGTQKRVKASAIVFAPHQDDETLGCGGIIILKRQAGTKVSCVFMTDGSASHRQFMDVEDLRNLRKAEAINAAKVLGLEETDLHFLNFEDGKLKRFHAAAVPKVANLIDHYRPEEVYVPHRADGLPDHEETHAIVMEAIRQVGHEVKIFQYPIWFWNQWPWVPLRIRLNRDSVKEILRVLATAFGLRLIMGCRHGVFVGHLLAKKRQALAQYRSQMTIFKAGSTWPMLSEVSEGEFLKCFFQEYEVFCCRKFAL